MSSTFKRLLVVDDDPSILRLIKKIFEHTYDLRVSKSPNDALKHIEEGFRPGVILSDQIMPHMSGAEFLNIAVQQVPSAVKVILTGHTETSEIIQCVNEARAHLYLTKPFETIQLVQAVKIAFEHHRSVHENMNKDAMASGFAAKNAEQQKTIESLKTGLKNIKDQILTSYNYLSKSNERLSYVPHTDYVIAMVSEMLQYIELRSDLAKRVLGAAKIHNAYRSCIPEHIAINKPMNISDKLELEIWLEGFNNFIKSLRATGLLDNTTVLIENLFENRIGTGMPNQRAEGQFHIDSQILSIANRYAMEVYGILPSDYEHTNRQGPWEQTEAETAERHQAAIESLKDRSKWYDSKVIDGFLKIFESNELLKPRTDTLRIE